MAKAFLASVVTFVGVPMALPTSVALAVSPTVDPATDPYSMKAVAEQSGVTAFWDQGYTGAGIDVAVIDTGVTPVLGLDGATKIVHGPDLSLEAGDPNLTHLDTNGHGTFMAGVIAGHDPDLLQPYSQAPSTSYRGIAPDARIVSVKVAGADGAVDVTQVIAAIDWVVDHRYDNGMNIRVLNLSFSTTSNQSYLYDPLSHAAERAWHAGIVVVAAAGNTGDGVTLTSPAYNPWILTVGAYDTQGTAETTDDVVGSYSASASAQGARRPDVVAAGSHIQGLRVPNSLIDLTFPAARIGERYFRGTGTSEAAAITSGTVALMLQKFPWMTPDIVKQTIMDTARVMASSSPNATGRGAIDVSMLSQATPTTPVGGRPSRAHGLGTIEASRGGRHIRVNGKELRGERDVAGQTVPTGMIDSNLTRGSWSGSTWSGSTWSGSTWSGSTWSGSTWSGSTWSGSTWSGSTWSGSTWSSGTWG